MSEHHQIKRLVLTVEAADPDEARRAQSRLDALQRQAIVPLLTRICDELAPPGRRVRIDQLTVDLGEVDADRFDAAFVAALGRTLRERLGRAVQGAAGRDDPDHEARPELEALAVFARTGALPWWSPTQSPTIVREGLAVLVREEPGQLADLLETLAREPQALARLAAHFDDEALAELVELLHRHRGSPLSAAGGAAAVHAELAEFAATREPLCKKSARERRSLLWRAQLALAARADRRSTAESLVTAALTEVAALAGLDPRRVLAQPATPEPGARDMSERAGDPDARASSHHDMSEGTAPPGAPGGAAASRELSAGNEPPSSARAPHQDDWRAPHLHDPRAQLDASQETGTPNAARTSHPSDERTQFDEHAGPGTPNAARTPHPGDAHTQLDKHIGPGTPNAARTTGADDQRGRLDSRTEAGSADAASKSHADDRRGRLDETSSPSATRAAHADDPRAQLDTSAGAGSPRTARASHADDQRSRFSTPAETAPPSAAHTDNQQARPDTSSETVSPSPAQPPAVPDQHVSSGTGLPSTAQTPRADNQQARPDSPPSPAAPRPSPSVRAAPAPASEPSSAGSPGAGELMGRHAPISQTEPKTPAPLAALNAALAALPSSAELHPLERLAGALSRTISPTGRDLTAAVIRTLQTGALASDDLERARHALTRPTAAALPEPVRRSLLAAIERAFHRPPPQQRRRPALDLRFSAADELYIDDAGLVLLWPFLGHFFQYLGLTTARSFRDDLARQRAAALLRVVTTGAAVVAEYQLPLAKLLCGLELDAVVDPGDAPSPAEVEECERLLDAVIARAEILKKMSTAGFRGTFLLREGSLSRRDGAWLLRVERRSYDLVLDRFPWGREWVKLPWMVTAIRVEW